MAEKEMVSKRNSAYLDFVRELSLLCGKKCFGYKDGEITADEEKCVARCTDLQYKSRDYIENCLEETINQHFLDKFSGS